MWCQVTRLHLFGIGRNDGEFHSDVLEQLRTPGRRGSENDGRQLHVSAGWSAAVNAPSFWANAASLNTGVAPSTQTFSPSSTHDLQPPYDGRIGISSTCG